MRSVLLECAEEFIGIVWWIEERAILFPFAFRRKEREDRKVGLAFRWDRVALEAPGQDENLVSHPLENAYPFLGLERNAIDVTDPTNDHPDIHCVLALARVLSAMGSRPWNTDRQGGTGRECVTLFPPTPQSRGGARSLWVLGISRSKSPDHHQRQRWRMFLRNHEQDITPMDFLVVPTVPFRSSHAWLVIGHGRRKILHFFGTDSLIGKEPMLPRNQGAEGPPTGCVSPT